MTIDLTNGFKRSHQGFSLIETLMQLAVLTIVTVPMIMLINLQRENIEITKQDTKNTIFAEQLFDVVTPQHPRPIEAFTVDSYTSGANTYLYSVLCDPASRTKINYDSYANTIDNTKYTTTCPLTGNGPDEDEGPFFRRTVTYEEGNMGLRVTVQLYSSRNYPAGTPIFEMSRVYDIDSFRLLPAQLVVDNGTTNNDVLTDFENNIYVDGNDSLWYPTYSRPATLSPAGGNNFTSYSVANGCSGSVTYNSGAAFPYYQNNTLNSASCPGWQFFFKAIPNTAYEVNIYTQIPAGASYGGSTTCLNNTVNSSCAMLDVTIRSRNATYTTSPTLKTIRYFDQDLAANGKGHPYMLHALVKTPADAAELEVIVKPSTPNTGTIVAFISGIEVVRRFDQ